MRRSHILFLLILNFSFFILNCFCAFAQKTGIAYCDLDHLYDTIPSPFYDDSNYTPRGKLRWDAERYQRKVAQAAGVIDSMALPIVALWGVENEAVVRDIVTASKGDYVYIHRTLNSLTGMDFALLYYGDRFFPAHIEEGRRYLYVEGTLRRPPHRPHGRPAQPGRIDTVGFVLCSESRMAAWVVRDVREERPGVKLVVLGRTEASTCSAYGLHDALTRAQAAGRGNIASRRGWQMRDRILVDTAFQSSGGDVFARSYLIDKKSGYPASTFDRKRYTGSYGYALPVFVYIE